MTDEGALEAFWDQASGGAPEVELSFRELLGCVSAKFPVLKSADGDALRRAYNYTYR